MYRNKLQPGNSWIPSTWINNHKTANFVTQKDETIPEFSDVSDHPVRTLCKQSFFFSSGSTVLVGPRPPHCRGFVNTLRHTTLGKTPLDEWSAKRRDLYPTIHNTHKRQTSMPPAGFEPTIPECERPQTYALDRAAAGIDAKQSTGENKYVGCSVLITDLSFLVWRQHLPSLTSSTAFTG
jgi:hypothetical protein